ncbi:MarR family transcriptional regulator [Dehalogenimonas sp. WBC-2]|nr:MarR family transcriptional regulator [Dehalogenimonas sp. WBC-2]
MADILHNKNASTRFQILVEIASKGPAIEQKAIATQLEITPQAISEYLKHMTADNLVLSEGRSRYRVTSAGVNWMLKELRELNLYVNLAEKAVTDISINAALALENIEAGQEVRLMMKDGILVASVTKLNGGAKGRAFNSAKANSDVGITDVNGIIPLVRGTITIAAVPSIAEGGSIKADTNRLSKLVNNQHHVAALGIEAFAALRGIGIEPRYFYAVPEVIIDAVRYGLALTIVCASEELPELTRKLKEASVDSVFIDLRL